MGKEQGQDGYGLSLSFVCCVHAAWRVLGRDSVSSDTPALGQKNSVIVRKFLSALGLQLPCVLCVSVMLALGKRRKMHFPEMKSAILEV